MDFKTTLSTIKAQSGLFYGIATGTKEAPFRFVFFFFAWSIALLFFSFSVLSGKNPLALFLPFSVFPIPHWESRNETIVYFLDSEGVLVPMKRLVFLPKDFKEKVYHLTRAIGRPAISHQSTPKKLLDLGPSLVSVWTRSNGKVLVLHWSKKAIETELSRYRVAKSPVYQESTEEESTTENYYSPPEVFKGEPEALSEKKKDLILSKSMEALDATLFANLPDLEIIYHRLDGKSEVWKDTLDYDFSQIKQRKAE